MVENFVAMAEILQALRVSWDFIEIFYFQLDRSFVLYQKSGRERGGRESKREQE